MADRFAEQALRLMQQWQARGPQGSDMQADIAAALRAAHAEGEAERDRLREVLACADRDRDANYDLLRDAEKERDRLRAELEAARELRAALPAYMHTRECPTETVWYAMTPGEREAWELDSEHGEPRLLAALARYDATRQP